jgi:hypothetical protein
MEHTTTYGYTDELVERARRTASEVKALVDRRLPPFDDTADRWRPQREATGPPAGR